MHRYPKSFAERRAVLKGGGGTAAESGCIVSTGGSTPSPSRRRFPARWTCGLAGLRPFGYAVEGRSLFLKGLWRIVYGEHALILLAAGRGF